MFTFPILSGRYSGALSVPFGEFETVLKFALILGFETEVKIGSIS